jgi:hypothetical protein
MRNAIDQSKLSIEVANRLHRRDCSALTQYAPLHPSRLTGIIFPGSGQYNRDQTYRSERRTGFELVETRLHTLPPNRTRFFTASVLVLELSALTCVAFKSASALSTHPTTGSSFRSAKYFG